MTTPRDSPRVRMGAFERTACECGHCRLTCRAMPGTLGPGDVDRIAAFVGAEPDEQFLQANFRAADPVSVTLSNGKEIEAPRVTPAQRDDGTCVFLAAEGRCSVHPAAPYACSRGLPCQHDEDRTRELTAVLLEANAASVDYGMTWDWLRRKGAVAPPAEEQIDRVLELAAELEVPDEA